MAKNSVILSLSEDEREALALCGITQDDQLARSGPHALLRDLEAAAAFFPEYLEYQPEFSRLEYICSQAAESLKGTRGEVNAMWLNSGHLVSGTITAQEEEPQKRRYSTATGRMLVDDHHETKKAEMLDESHRREDPRGFSHAICNTHPVSIYLSAWATVFLVAAVLGLLMIVAGLLIGIEYKSEIVPAVAVLGGIIIFYALMLRSATCSTCRVAPFSFRRYPRHRKSHYFPLLGYTLSSALHTIFLFRFRCPSCGTPQKLFGHRHRSRSNRHVSRSHHRKR